MKTWVSIAAVTALVGGAAYAGLASAGPEARPLDSGRYGVEAACEPKAAFLTHVVQRYSFVVPVSAR